MPQTGFFGWRADGTRTSAPQPAASSPLRARHRELKLKFAALQQEYAGLHTALFEAAQVHRRLCAPRLVRCGEYDIASEIFAVRYLPGDFFTVEETDGGTILALGDVCGKGLAAGMWTPCLVGLVRAHAAASSEPQAIVTGVNREFCRMHAPLTSLLMARLDPASGTLDYCSAGHPPALLLRANGQLEFLSEGGMLLGMAPDASFRRGRVVLGAGDVLLAYSDGVIESRNDAEQEFGWERLEAQLRLAGNSSADAVLFSVLGAVQDFAAPRELIDDTSLVVIRQGDVIPDAAR
ncbi:MAG TPA: PP2C family protein-serine/threonine phosphatase [Vicinamibacterales bacterium]|nr:PP2C family protein-serine/threonine phosphatase [Vicinamibacterales bacterium]